MQGVELLLDVGQPRLEQARLEVACLEGLVVAVERALASADLLGDDALLGLDRRPVCRLLLVGALQRGSDKVAVAVEAGELAEDGVLELVAVQPFAITSFTAELLSAGAGVVVVEAAVALRRHADVGAATASAADYAGEQELGAVAAPPGQILAPLPQQRLCRLEGVLIDERRVQAGEALAAPVHAAEIRLVLQQPLDDCGLPAAGGRRGMLVGEQPGDRGRAEPALGVEPEDPRHHRRLPLVRNDELLRVAAVAEGDPARGPPALLRTPLDPGGDPVDDRRVLELREYRQHLQHHPPGGGTRIEGLRCGAEGDAGSVELLRQLRQLPHLPAETVDAVDEQQVDLPVTGELERRLQAGTVELRPGRPILLVGDNPPPPCDRTNASSRSRCECSEVGWFSSSVEIRVYRHTRNGDSFLSSRHL